MENGEPTGAGTSAFIRDEEHLERAFNRGAYSAGIAFVRGEFDILGGISWQRRV